MIFRSPFAEPSVPDLPLDSFVLERAAELAGKPAVVDAGTGRSLTYDQLARHVAGVAGGLVGIGLGKGDVLATLLPNLPEFPVAFYGVARAGGVCTTMNPLYTAPEIAAQLRDSGARFLLTLPSLIDKARTASEGLDIRLIVLGQAVGAISLERLVVDGRSGGAPDIAGEDVVALPYSSGTTGLPKGVMLTHRNLVANAIQCGPWGVTDSDVFMAVAPFFHIMGMSCIMTNGLCRGATLVTMARFDFEEFLAAVEQHRVSCAVLPPPVVLALTKSPLVDRYDLSSLRWIVSGAAPLGAELEQACARRLDCQTGQAWGMSECGLGTAYPAGSGKVGTVGVCVPGSELRVVDPQTGAQLGPGETGEIWHRGPNVMKGYLHHPEATAAAITSDGWLRTGDIGSVDADGFVSVVDRLKELIKYKGYQVAPAELEAVLVSHPLVADAVVIPSPDDQAGEVPKAFLVLTGDADRDLAPNQILQWVADQVAPYKRIRHHELIDTVPRTNTGKILRRDLILRERNLHHA